MNGAKAIAAMAVLLAYPLAYARDGTDPFLLTSRSERAAAPTSNVAKTVTIPAQTEVATELLSGIHTQLNQVGDAVTARLSKALYIDGRLALPPGTLLDGSITKIRSAGRWHRPAELALRFEKIALPDGQTEAVRGILTAVNNPRPLKVRLDDEGYLEGARALSWKGVAGTAIALGALAVARVPLGGTSMFGTIVPASGAATLTYIFFWRRGNDVHLPPETPCRVRLTYPVTVRVPW
jgi:hypothetical protein